LSSKAIEFGEKKMQNKCYYAVKGHLRSSRSVSIERPYFRFKRHAHIRMRHTLPDCRISNAFIRSQWRHIDATI